MQAGGFQRITCNLCASLGVCYTSLTHPFLAQMPSPSSRGETQSRSRLPFHFPLFINIYTSRSLFNPPSETDTWCTTRGVVAKDTASSNKKSGQSPWEQQLRVGNTDMLGVPVTIALKADWMGKKGRWRNQKKKLISLQRFKWLEFQASL